MLSNLDIHVGGAVMVAPERRLVVLQRLVMESEALLVEAHRALDVAQRVQIASLGEGRPVVDPETSLPVSQALGQGSQRFAILPSPCSQ